MIDTILHIIDTVLHIIDTVLHIIDTVLHVLDSLLRVLDTVLHIIDTVRVVLFQWCSSYILLDETIRGGRQIFRWLLSQVLYP